MDDGIMRQALAWHAAQQLGDADWDGFASWLESDQAHRSAYDAVALIDDAACRHRNLLAQIFPDQMAGGANAQPLQGGSRWRRWWPAIGLGVAAAMALVVAVPTFFFDDAPAPVSYSTGPGQVRSIALADGSHVELAAASRLVVSGRRQDDMRLDGAAYFSIVHDANRSLVIHAGDYDVRDIGTRFEVTTGNGVLKVAVAQGQLSVTSGALARAVRLRGGQRLLLAEQQGTAEVADVMARDVGAWREGRLVYQDAPLSLVSADISRYVGRPVVADPAIAARRFSGVLTIGDGSGLVGNLQQFMGLGTRVEGNSVRLVPGRGD